MIPSSLVKPLLFPGAIAKSLIAGSKLPTYHHLFIFYSFHDLNHGASFSSDIHHLEVFAGSCLCLLGALLNLFKPTRISFIGTLLIYWGLSYQRHSSLRLCSSQKLWPTLFTHTAIECLNMNSKATKGGRRVIARRIAKGRHKVTT